MKQEDERRVVASRDWACVIDSWISLSSAALFYILIMLYNFAKESVKIVKTHK